MCKLRKLKMYCRNPRRYLIARNVRIGHINKHIGLARKVNNFLESGAEEGSEVRKHAGRMDDWLGRLEAQLSAAMPTIAAAGAPDSAPRL